MFLSRLLLLAVVLASSVSAQCPSWSKDFNRPGFDSSVEAFCTFDDGSGAGPRLYAGGSFTLADGALAGGLALFDGATWREVGGGLDGGVRALLVFDDGSGPALYVGGDFLTAGGVPCSHVARWNGTSFTPVGAGVDGTVYSLGAYDSGAGPELYVGGSFAASGATPRARLARWTGADWSDVGGGTDGAVLSMLAFQGELVIAGTFAHAGALATTGIARWNGGTWSTFGTNGLPAAARALAVYDPGTGPKLYAGGDFFSLAPSFGRLARWSGTAWESPGPNILNTVKTLRTVTDFFGSALYAGGSSDLVAGSGPVLRIQGNSVSGVFTPNGLGGDVHTVAGATIGGLPAAVIGGFLTSSTRPIHNVAVRVDPNGWMPLGAGNALQFVPLSIESVPTGPLAGTYVGGNLEVFGAATPADVFRWNGTSFQAVPTPIPGACWTLRYDPVPPGGRLLVAATTVSIATASLWSWDGVAWTLLGAASGPPSSSGGPKVYDLAWYDSGTGRELYAVGEFTTIGGVPANNIARFDGVAWHPLGGGLNFDASALCVFDDGSGERLYVRGRFTLANGVAAEGIASWDGTNLVQVGSGLPHVRDHLGLFVFDDGSGEQLYATMVSTSLDAAVRRWDGVAWSDVGGLNGRVRGVAVFDDGSGGGAALHAFVDQGGISALAPGMERWDGSTWSHVADGVFGGTGAHRLPAAVHGSSLWVGGPISIAGIESFSIARYDGCGPVSSFCAGDGVDAHVTTACPCGNVGGVGRGCAWHAGPTGALLAASGTTNPDALVLTASGMPNSAPSTIFLKGDVLISGGVAFGDGVRCIGGNLIRLGTKVNVGGAAQYPEAGNVSISVRGQTPVGSGAIGYYQTYYRNAAVFCTSSTFNVTNAVRVVW